MKNILLTLFLLIPIIFFGQDKKDDKFNITKNWVSIQLRQRTYFQKRDLLKLDDQTVSILEKNDIPADIEPDVADLIYEIMKYNSSEAKDVAIRAVVILEKKFKNKDHFYRIAADFSNYYGRENPLIIAQFFKSMKSLLYVDFSDNVRALKKLYDIIRTPYIIEPRSGSVKKGTETVQQYIKDYIYEIPKS